VNAVRLLARQPRATPLIVPSRRAWSNSVREIRYRAVEVELSLDERLLDPAARWLAGCLADGALDLVGWCGRTQAETEGVAACGPYADVLARPTVWDLPMPVWHTDATETPTRWLNGIVTDWRRGTAYRPPLLRVRARFGPARPDRETAL